MSWINLKDFTVLKDLEQESFNFTCLIFKHSKRCSISLMVLDRFKRNFFNYNMVKCYLLDLLACREISNEISEKYKIEHESPQILLIKKNTCVYSASHNMIDSEIVKHLLNEWKSN